MHGTPLKTLGHAIESSRKLQRSRVETTMPTHDGLLTSQRIGKEHNSSPFVASKPVDMTDLMELLKGQASSLSLDDTTPSKHYAPEGDQAKESLAVEATATKTVLSRASRSHDEKNPPSVTARVTLLKHTVQSKNPQVLKQSYGRNGRKRIQRHNAMLVLPPADEVSQPAFKVPDRKKTPTFVTQSKLPSPTKSKKATELGSEGYMCTPLRTDGLLEEQGTPLPPPPPLCYRISSFGTNLFTDSIESSPLFTTKARPQL